MIAIINDTLMRAIGAVAGLRAHLADERGQTLMEYAVLAGVIVVFIGGLTAALAATGAMTNMANAIAECVDFDSTCP